MSGLKTFAVNKNCVVQDIDFSLCKHCCGLSIKFVLTTTSMMEVCGIRAITAQCRRRVLQSPVDMESSVPAQQKQPDIWTHRGGGSTPSANQPSGTGVRVVRTTRELQDTEAEQ